MKAGGFIDKEKAELWVSTHNTAPRVQAWGQAHQGQGPLHLRDLAHPHHPELSGISFSSNPSILHGHSLDKVSGSPWWGARTRVWSEAEGVWWVQDPLLLSLLLRGMPVSAPAHPSV